MDFSALLQLIKSALIWESFWTVKRLAILMGAAAAVSYLLYTGPSPDETNNNIEDAMADIAKDAVKSVSRSPASLGQPTLYNSPNIEEAQPAFENEKEDSDNKQETEEGYADQPTRNNDSDIDKEYASDNPNQNNNSYRPRPQQDYNEPPSSVIDDDYIGSGETAGGDTPSKGEGNVILLGRPEGSNVAKNNTPEEAMNISDPADITVPPSGNSLSCSFDKPQGTYGAALSVTLTCSEAATIRYCIQLGGGYCDPLTTSTIYTGPVSLNLGDNIYGLSFYAQALSTSNSFVPQDLSYTIDSVPPNLTVSFPQTQVQTTELPFLSSTQSTDYGKAMDRAN